MVNHSKAVNMVEAVIGEGKSLLSIGNFELAGSTEQIETLLAQFDGFGRQIDSDIPCSILGELEPVGCNAAANFQNVLSTKRGELGDGRYVPLATLIPFSANVFKVLSAVLFGRQVRLAGVPIPKGFYVSNSCIHELRALICPVLAKCVNKCLRRSSCSSRWNLSSSWVTGLSMRATSE